MLQAETLSRKYGQRTRCRRLPAVVALLRNWVEAPARIASDNTG
ncbi:hypothetical protein APX70_200231 [Pseudomonas syringae pv. maculicola]|uniref:Uncharacterized protein n=1 Tax=Pseudomonas syringae pv. maculicola TaxID=59511 RepID=A0A3M3AR98_PSEYM|nr:hypothetical protein APX70_200231 [Pseudomonas syringae pv. maculicola]